VALEVGETEDAIGLYKQILALDPGDVETLLVVGHLCEQCGQTENALGFLQRVLDKEPNNAHALEAVGRIRKLTAGVQEGDHAEMGQGTETAVVGG
jgi:cytochrome c-type biogenesis protein CcmH/NrfG